MTTLNESATGGLALGWGGISASPSILFRSLLPTRHCKGRIKLLIRTLGVFQHRLDGAQVSFADIYLGSTLACTEISVSPSILIHSLLPKRRSKGLIKLLIRTLGVFQHRLDGAQVSFADIYLGPALACTEISVPPSILILELLPTHRCKSRIKLLIRMLGVFQHRLDGRRCLSQTFILARRSPVLK